MHGVIQGRVIATPPRERTDGEHLMKTQLTNLILGLACTLKSQFR
jgi:hypothetical protein